jgi:polyisoprenoid-binding protein YceI
MYAKLIAIAAAGLVAGTAWAAPESYTIDSGHTFPSFEISHVGFSTHRGRFNKTNGRIVLDRAAKKVDAEIVIDASSVDTGGTKLDEHLRKADFFDVEKYPTITFKSTGARFNGDVLTALDGQLTMHGETKPVTLTVSNFKCGNHPMNKKALCGADVSTTIKRSDFGMKYGVPVLGDEVKLLIQVEAFKDA